jgi:hypothetical protein
MLLECNDKTVDQLRALRVSDLEEIMEPFHKKREVGGPNTVANNKRKCQAKLVELIETTPSLSSFNEENDDYQSEISTVVSALTVDNVKKHDDFNSVQTPNKSVAGSVINIDAVPQSESRPCVPIVSDVSAQLTEIKDMLSELLKREMGGVVKTYHFH